MSQLPQFGSNAKLYIVSLDTKIKVEAQFNPKELEFGRNIPWQKHAKANADGLQLEFNGAEGRTLSLELLFDGYETGQSVQDDIDILEQMASVQVPASKQSKERRPHHVMVVYGSKPGPFATDKYKGVIEGLTTKYTMFRSDGVPVRATVIVKLKEASTLTMAAAK